MTLAGRVAPWQQPVYHLFLSIHFQFMPDRLASLLRRGPAAAHALAAQLGISQPTFSRLVRSAPGVVPLGRARARRYALARDVRGLGHAFPVQVISEAGQVVPWGTLLALHGGMWLERAGGGEGGLFDDLPYFLQDMRPQGFIGRAFPARHADLGLTAQISRWSSDDILVALARRGEDCVGNLVLGEESLARYLAARAAPTNALSPRQRYERYPALADAASAGELAGSSAGGEHPKFAAVIRSGNDFRHVLVKYSPPLDTPAARRWADLLRAEHAALALLNAHGIAAAKTEFIEAGNRAFLEVDRFDRLGANGRRGLVSLAAIDGAFFGREDNWAAAAGRLEAAGMIDTEEARRLRWLTVFGRQIGNTDMHFGNVSFFPAGRGRFELAPAYDMLPMLFAPTERGELVARPFAPATPGAELLPVWDVACAAAQAFWDAVANDAGFSAAFRRDARACRDALPAARALAGVFSPPG